MLEDQDKPLVTEQAAEYLETRPTARKKFIEPQISQPVDVLEATTYLQLSDSGETVP